MRLTSRAAWALGLSLVGAAGFVGSTFGQGGDAKVQKTSTQGANTSPALPAVVGTVDLDAVMKAYEKVKSAREQLQADAMVKQNQLTKIMADMKSSAKKLEALTAGTAEAKKEETEYTKLKVQLDAERESAQREFSQREAEALATIYKEIQATVADVARHLKLTLVVRTSNEPINGSEPNSVMAAMARHTLYADPQTDITNWVISTLNRRYQTAGGAAAKQATAPTTSSKK